MSTPVLPACRSPRPARRGDPGALPGLGTLAHLPPDHRRRPDDQGEPHEPERSTKSPGCLPPGSARSPSMPRTGPATAPRRLLRDRITVPSSGSAAGSLIAVAGHGAAAGRRRAAAAGSRPRPVDRRVGVLAADLLHLADLALRVEATRPGRLPAVAAMFLVEDSARGGGVLVVHRRRGCCCWPRWPRPRRASRCGRRRRATLLLPLSCVIAAAWLAAAWEMSAGTSSRRSWAGWDGPWPRVHGLEGDHGDVDGRRAPGERSRMSLLPAAVRLLC